MRSVAFYFVFPASAALLNLAGYAFSLWHEETAFDELVHLWTSFAIVAALGCVLMRSRGATGELSLSTLLAAGLFLGLAWEAFEMLVGMIGSFRDTMVDLAMDMIGASLAFVLVRRAFARDAAAP